jgi:hypothetical protein
MYWPGKGHHVLGQLLHLLDAAGQGLDGDVLGRPHLLHFDDQVGLGLGAAEQGQSLGLVLLAQGAFLEHAVVHGAGQDLALAGAAGAVATAVGQGKARVQGGGQQGFAGLDGKLVAAGLDGDLVRHDQFLLDEYADSNCRMR